MLKKLIKYDFRGISRMLLLLHGILLALIIMGRIFLNFFLGSPIEGPITSIIIALGFVLIVSVGMFTFIYPGFYFYRKVFTNEGYLTNTLPITPRQLILSKGLVSFIWMMIDVIVILVSVLILLSSSDLPNQLKDMWGLIAEAMYYPSVKYFVIITIIGFLFGLIEQLLLLYLSIALGNQLFPGHKAIGSVGVYFGIYTVMQLIGTAVLFIFGRGYLVLMTNSTITPQPAIGFEEIFTQLNSPMTVSLVLSILYLVLFYLFTIHIMDKHLNMQ